MEERIRGRKGALFMKFKGKIDFWFWIVMLLGEALLIGSLFTPEGGIIIGIIITAFYNIIFLPIVFRNYVEVSDEKVTVVVGFSKQSIAISEIKEVYKTNNPIASSAASLDRIVIKAEGQKMMCAVQDKEKFFECLKEKNSRMVIHSETREGRKTTLEKAIIIFCIATFVLVGILLMTGNINVEYNDTSCTIIASYWYDLEIEYDEIESIEYRDEKVSGSRVGGFGSFRLLMGDFRNDEFGNYTRYTYADCDAGVVLRVNGREVVISGKDKESTQAIYDEILIHCEIQ